MRTSDECGTTEFCWSGLCWDTADAYNCDLWENKATIEGWKWNNEDLYTDSGFKCASLGKH